MVSSETKMLIQFIHTIVSIPLLSDFDDSVVYIFLLLAILGGLAHLVVKKIKLKGSESDLLGKDSYGLQNYTLNFSNLGVSKYESTGFRKASLFVRAIALLLIVLIIGMPLYEMIPGLEPTPYYVYFGCMLP